MNNAAVDFNNQNFEDKQRYMDRVFNISMNPRNRMFKNFVSAAFVSTTPTFEKKDRFTVIPQAGVKDGKAVTKASIATQFIGFGEGIVGKDGKRSTTQIYREQAGTLANTGKYSGTDVIFVSVPGLRGDAAVVKREQDKTIREAIKAIEAGATILTDNKAYIDSSNYNTGEKRLYQNLEAKGYNYSEIKIDGQPIGTWRKATAPTTQPKQGPEPGEQLDLFDTQYQLPKGREVEEYVATEKTIRDLAARMSSRIGINVKFESDRTKKYKGKLENNTAIINLAYATLDTPIHEILGHPIIRAIKNRYNKGESRGYDFLDEKDTAINENKSISFSSE
jgi:hypothetical protein